MRRPDFHESGHAICAAALGLQVQAATVVATGEYAGMAWFQTPEQGADPEAYLTAVCGGPVAEGIFLQLPPAGLYSPGDWQHVATVTQDPRRIAAAEQRARDLLLGQWDAVADLAAQLARAAEKGQAIAGIGAEFALWRGLRARRWERLRARARAVGVRA